MLKARSSLSQISRRFKWQQQRYSFKSDDCERSRLDLQNEYLRPLLHLSFEKIPFLQSHSDDAHAHVGKINILDVGFGTGSIIDELLQYCRKNGVVNKVKIHAIDNQEESIQFVTKRFEKEIYEGQLCVHNIDVTNTDALMKLLKFDPSIRNGFDLITIRFVLCHLKQQWPTLVTSLVNDLLLQPRPRPGARSSSYLMVHDGDLSNGVKSSSVSDIDIGDVAHTCNGKYAHLNWFQNNLTDLFDHLICWHVPHQIEEIVALCQNSKIVLKDTMQYGGCNGTTGHTVALDATEKLAKIAVESQLISKQQYAQIYHDIGMFKKETVSDIYAWNTVYGMLIEKSL